MKPPGTFAQILEAYGDIRPYIKPDGTLRPEWEYHNLTTVDLPEPLILGWDPEKKVERLRCHVKLKDHFAAAFHSIHAAGLWPELKTFDGCFNFRAQRGSARKLSLHSFGAAIDLNAGTNERGTPGDMPGGIVQCFEAVGFVWGGRWDTPDPMHFEFTKGIY